MEEGVNYKVHPDYPNYMIGDDGSVWSNRVQGARKNSPNIPWKKLASSCVKSGHKIAQFYENGKGIKLYIHRLVLELFIGPCPDGMECLHNDGNPGNNKVDNLRWGTHKENVEDAKRHKTFIYGEKVGGSILKEPQVLEIIKMLKDGKSVVFIASLFNVSQKCISHIKNGNNWKYLTKGEKL